MKPIKTVVRFAKPNRFDMAPYGTVYEYNNEGKTQLWMQVSKSEEHGTAEWINDGDLLVKVLQIPMGLNDFIMECLSIYSGEKTLPKSNLRHILAELKDEDENVVDL